MRRHVAGVPVPAMYLAVAASVLLFVAYPLLRMAAQVVVGDLSLADCGDILLSQADVMAGSALVALLSAILSTALALALVVVFGNRVMGRLMVGIATMSIISPPFVASLAYIMLFGRRGLITHGMLGLDVSPYGWPGVVIMQTLFFAAINVLMIASVLRRVDARVLDAARDVGAPVGRVLVDVVLPLLWPTLLSCLMLTFVRSLSDYGTPVVIGGSFETVASEIYLQIVGYSDLGMAALLNLLLMGVAILVFVGYGRLATWSDRLVAAAPASAMDEGSGPGLRLGGVPGAVSYALSALFLAFMVVLYATIVRTAFSSGIGWAAQPTLSNLQHLARFSLPSLGRSLAYAAIAAAIATLLALTIAYYVHRRRILGGRALEFMVTLPYLIPGTCFGLGYLLAFNAAPLKLTGTAAIIVLVLIFKQLTISEQTFSQTMAQISPELDMAARDLGASGAGVFADVIVPNLRSAMLVSLVNVFSTSMVAYGAVLFLVSAGHKTAVFELFDALSGGTYGAAAMMSLAILVVTLAVNGVLAHVVTVGRR